MDVGHGSNFYGNLSSIRAANNDDYFPRFSRQRCGGSNRNGSVFTTYSNSGGMLASARAAYAHKPSSPRGRKSYEEIAGDNAMGKRMQASVDFNASNPNLFRIKPMLRPELPVEARRGSSPRTSMHMGDSQTTMRGTMRSLPVSPTSGARRAKGPFAYERVHSMTTSFPPL